MFSSWGVAVDVCHNKKMPVLWKRSKRVRGSILHESSMTFWSKCLKAEKHKSAVQTSQMISNQPQIITVPPAKVFHFFRSHDLPQLEVGEEDCKPYHRTSPHSLDHSDSQHGCWSIRSFLDADLKWLPFALVPGLVHIRGSVEPVWVVGKAITGKLVRNGQEGQPQRLTMFWLVLAKKVFVRLREGRLTHRQQLSNHCVGQNGLVT